MLAYTPQFHVSDVMIMVLCIVGLRLAIVFWTFRNTTSRDMGLMAACDEYARENPSKVEYDRQFTR